MEEQVVAIFAGINGYLDGVPVPQVPRFQDELREHMRTETSILDAILEQKEISDELEGKLNAELKRFAGMFNVQEEGSLVS
jgi:F-type H+-transporting ATPase subunit alpha